jgi:transcriptional regulator with XRE-family HTH domain
MTWEQTVRDATPKAAGAIDRHVGNRIRVRRLQLEMSQEKLAHTLGITFQQVQKYEKGANRVSVGRLYEIAAALEVPLSYFYPEATSPAAEAGAQEVADLVGELAGTPETLTLLRAFSRIESRATRRRVVELVQALAEGGEGFRLLDA